MKNSKTPRLLYVQYTNPANYPPLEHSGLILTKAGWSVRFLGIHSEGESNKLTFPPALAARSVMWRRSAPGFFQKLHFVAFTLSAVWQAWWQRQSWVYCSDLTSCPAAWLIHGLTRCRVLYHEHDSPADSDPRPGISLSRFQRFLLWTRKRVGQSADLVVLPNERRLELFNEATRRGWVSLCVYNCPRLEELWAQASPRAADGVLRLAFHGSINHERLPTAVLEAMSRFPGRVHLSVVGYETSGSVGYMQKFLQLADQLRLGGAVEFLGAMPRQAIFAPAAKCHVGLAFMPLQGGDVNMANMAGASNKPFDYLACGLALLVSARPEWEEMFVAPGYGRACRPGDADSLAAELAWFLENPLATWEMGRRGRHRVREEWNYESQFAPVLDILQKSQQPPIRK